MPGTLAKKNNMSLLVKTHDQPYPPAQTPLQQIVNTQAEPQTGLDTLKLSLNCLYREREPLVQQRLKFCIGQGCDWTQGQSVGGFVSIASSVDPS